ncbi:hypothetical protein [Paludisphaera mucosa]|uniref:Minor tail protein n=1 Tax=Paludisphaera mucosa TaxID=3030827 RepID=A0ABT6FLQ3_9BACT|nr:hypothetical protein [Paludisphaera mucosa]MDG3008494.1 hypothetical protein [Paludisphaera mucosa]
MKLLTGRPKAKRREVKFSPDWSARSGYGRLESRALTAPAIYRRPPAFPNSPPDGVNAWVNGGTPVFGVQSSTAGGTIGAGTLTAISQATTSVVDAANPGSPSGPVGSGAASFTAATQCIVSGGFGFLPAGAGTDFNRGYRLASTTGAIPAAFVRQTYSYEFHGSGIAIFNAQARLATPNLVIGGTNLGVTITVGNGTPFAASPSGTVVNGAQTVTWTCAITGGATPSVIFRVVDIQAVGALPAAGYLPNGDAAGTPWVVASQNGAGGAFQAPGMSTITAGYSLEIFTTRPS